MSLRTRLLAYYRRTGTRRSRYAKNLFSLISANLVAQALPIAITPIAARLYTPGDYGILAVFLAWTTLTGTIATMRLDWLLSSAHNERRATAYIRWGIFYCTSVAILVEAIIFVLQYFTPDVLGSEQLRPLLWLIPPVACLNALSQIGAAWLVRKAALGIVSKIRIEQGLIGAAVNLLCGALGLGALGLVLATVAASVTGILRLFRHVPPLFCKTEIGALSLLATIRHNIRRALTMGATGAVNAGGLYLPVILIGYFHTTTELGWYALISRIAQAPIYAFGSAITQSFWGEIAVEGYKAPSEVARLFFSTVRRLLPLSAICLLMCLAGPLYVGTLLGASRWADAGLILSFLAPYFASQIIVSPLAVVLTNFGYERWLLLWDIARTIAVVLVFCGANYLGLSFFQAILVFSLTMTAAYILLYRKMHIVISRSSRTQK